MSDEASSASNLAQAGLAVPALVLADGLSYEEYFKQINKMAEQMRARWQREEKVGALKVAIQLSKLLADTSQLKLYAKKYSRVMDILDEFGKYIYERVHSLANQRPPLQEASNEFSIDPNELARDIYRNWQFKILSIRELVPRFYTELAILRASDILFISSTSTKQTIKSLEDQFYLQSLRRLGAYCMGLGDPIVALHARAYLCRVAERLITWDAPSRQTLLLELIMSNLKSSALVVCRLEMPWIHQEYPKHSSQQQQQHHSDVNLYFELLAGAFQSILGIITLRYGICSDEGEDVQFVTRARERLSATLIELLDDNDDDNNNNLAGANPCALGLNVILHSLFVCLPSELASQHAPSLLKALRASHAKWIAEDNDRTTTIGPTTPASRAMIPSIYTTLASLLTALDGSETFELESNNESGSSPSSSPLGLAVIELAQTMLADLLAREHASQITANYLRCSKALLTFASHHAPQALSEPLTTLVRHLARGRQYVQHYAHIMDLIKTLFTQHSRGLAAVRNLVGLRPFQQLFDFLRKDEHRLDVARYIMEMLRSNIKMGNETRDSSGVELIRDQVLIKFLLKLFDTANSSLSPLAAPEDLKHLSEVVIFFIRLVRYDQPHEQMEFYSRCRGSLGNLNQALCHLIERVLELPQAHRALEKRRQARQNMLNCCLAFAFTTLPAVQEPRARVQYYARGCRLALAHRSLSLADYYLRQIMVNLLGSVESHELQQHSRDTTELHNNSDKKIDERVTAQVAELLELMIKYQDYIDLKHKLALSQLVRVSFAGHERLLACLNNLNCVDDDDDDHNDGDPSEPAAGPKINTNTRTNNNEELEVKEELHV